MSATTPERLTSMDRGALLELVRDLRQENGRCRIRFQAERQERERLQAIIEATAAATPTPSEIDQALRSIIERRRTSTDSPAQPARRTP